MTRKPFISQHWHELYVELMGNPNDHRSDKEFCDEIKIAVSTLQTWKRSNRVEIYEEAQKRRKHYLNELRSLAWKALTSKMDKDLNAVKLAFQLTGDLVEKTEVTTGSMEYRDKVQRLEALMRDARERQTTWKKVEESQAGTTNDSGNPGVVNESLGPKSGENPPATGEIRPIEPGTGS